MWGLASLQTANTSHLLLLVGMQMEKLKPSDCLALTRQFIKKDKK
jgi:hypothetical protein